MIYYHKDLFFIRDNTFIEDIMNFMRTLDHVSWAKI